MSLPSLAALNPAAVGVHAMPPEWQVEPEGANVTIDPDKDYGKHALVWQAIQFTYNWCWRASNPGQREEALPRSVEWAKYRLMELPVAFGNDVDEAIFSTPRAALAWQFFGKHAVQYLVEERGVATTPEERALLDRVVDPVAFEAMSVEDLKAVLRWLDGARVECMGVNVNVNTRTSPGL